MPATLLQDLAPVPDSTLCRRAFELVQEVYPSFLCNHCLRTYVFGSLLAHCQQLSFDRELFFLAAVLHDLGLSERFDSDQRFELDGADAAHTFAIEHGLSAQKAEQLWDAIALHTSTGIALRKGPEAALVHLGAGMDVFGLGLDAIEPSLFERVICAYPRLRLKEELTQLFVSQIRRKPQTVPFTWLADVARCRMHGFSYPSYDELLSGSPFDE